MGYNETDIGSDLKLSGGQPIELWGFGIQVHPDGQGQLHIGQQAPGCSPAAVSYVAAEAADGGIPAMLAAATAVSPSLRAWMDAVGADPRCVALGGLQAVETRFKLRHIYGA